MDIEKINEELEIAYNRRYKSVDKRVSSVIQHLEENNKLNVDELELAQMRSLITSILNLETKSLQEDVETLLAQKDLIERSLEKKKFSASRY